VNTRVNASHIIGVAALSGAFGWPLTAHATPMEGNTPYTASTSDDVLLGKQPDIVLLPNAGANSANAPPRNAEGGNSTTWGTLTDGAAGTYSNSGVVTAFNGDDLTYYLANVNTDPYGVNLTSTDIFSAWGDGGRIDQNVTVLYSTTANSGSFQTLATVSYAHTGGSSNYIFTSTATAVNNVARLQFVFGTQQNGYVGYQEIVPHGSVATSGTAIAPQNGLIQNGSFETPVANGVDYEPIASWVASGLANTGTNSNTGDFSPAGGANTKVPDGNQFAFIQVGKVGTGSLGEKLDNLVIGQQYDLTYYISQRNGNNVTSSLQPSIDGQAIGLPNVPTAGWTQESYDFTYNGSDPTPTLSFVDTNTDGIDETIDLDDVQLTAIGVPEPATLSLTALAGITLLRRRRTR
jgi:hypothetical protein